MDDHVRLYIAARYISGSADPLAANPGRAAAGAEPYPYHLESYHYVKNGQFDDAIRENGHKLFMDSGAFSMFTQGITVSLEDYAEFLRGRRDYIEVASNVDVIGRASEQASYDNQKILESMDCGVRICPVHHARDDDKWLVKYIDEGYDYIFLGGMVPETTGYLVDWLDHIFDKYLALPDGTARVKIHAFGVTTFELMEAYPWFSLDSTRWVLASRYGIIFIPPEKQGGRVRMLAISRSSPTVHNADRNFWSLDAHTRDHIERIIRAEGFTPDDLGDLYGMRDCWNIRFFRQYAETLHPVFKRRDVSFF